MKIRMLFVKTQTCDNCCRIFKTQDVCPYCGYSYSKEDFLIHPGENLTGENKNAMKFQSAKSTRSLAHAH